MVTHSTRPIIAQLAASSSPLVLRSRRLSGRKPAQNQPQNIAKKSHEAILTNTEESSTYSGNSASGGSAGGAYYKNCKAVWDVLGHGITRNDLGYRSKLEADGDGYACEYPPNY